MHVCNLVLIYDQKISHYIVHIKADMTSYKPPPFFFN